MDVKDYIRTIPDFPAKGVMFRDVTTVLQDAQGFRLAIDQLQKLVEVIVGIESRGFLFGTPIAYNLNKAFVPVRKKGKLPFNTIEQEYSLEYGNAVIEMHSDAIKPGQRVVIIDDLIATGGTVKAAAQLVERLGGSVEKAVFLIELPFFKGRELLSGYNIGSVVQFDGE